MSIQKPFAMQGDLVTFTLLSNGTELIGTYQVTSIEVVKKINRITEARIELLDGNPATGTFEESEKDDFIPGKKIEIKAGYDSKEQVIFKGIITRHCIQSYASSVAKLLVICNDEAIKMTVGRKNAFFKNKTDSSILSDITSNYDLSTAISSTSTEHKEVIQYYTTDWDFLITRAEMNGQIVVVDDGHLSTQVPKVSAAPVIEVLYGESIYDFNLTLDARFQLTSAKSEAWDMSSQSTLSATSSSPSVNSQGNISASDLAKVLDVSPFQLQSTAALSQSELKTWADAQLLKSWMSKIQGSIRFPGNAVPKPGTLIKINGLGARFNGNGFISGVTHLIEEGNWSTEIELGLAADWFASQPDIVAPNASGLLPGIQGLQNGKVKQIYEDPEEATRILVEIPIMDTSEATVEVWARLANFYATANAGAFFMPEVGDEVVLGFLNNDPRFPIILGSLYSSAKSPPYTPNEPNSIKAIVSKNQLKVIFDDEQKILTLETPNGNKMIYSDEAESITIEDQNSNKIELSPEGIKMQSESNIKIEANGTVSISGKAGVNISSDADVNVSGLNIKNSAEMEFSAEAELAAKLSSSLEVTIEGVLVKIN